MATHFSARICVSLGDYYEIPETCPFMTTCPVVCVASVKDCPTSCHDNEAGWNLTTATSLCVSGSCETDCGHYNEETDNPCTCPLYPIACPTVVDFYDECFAMFQPYYDNNTCSEEESESPPSVSYTGFYYRLCYSWISAITLLVIGWCFFNEKLCRNTDQTSLPMRTAGSNQKPRSGKEKHDAWIQVGYRRTVIGTLLCALVLLTVVGIQLLLLLLCILYNVQNGSITRWSPAFESMSQVEKTFILTWMVGFPWTLSLKYVRSGLDTLFLRRCPIRVGVQWPGHTDFGQSFGQ
jgi:hypothetical protein